MSNNFRIYNGILKRNFTREAVTKKNMIGLSIEKWDIIYRYLLNGMTIGGYGSDSCALCIRYLNADGCHKCPLSKFDMPCRYPDSIYYKFKSYQSPENAKIILDALFEIEIYSGFFGWFKKVFKKQINGDFKNE